MVLIVASPAALTAPPAKAVFDAIVQFVAAIIESPTATRAPPETRAAFEVSVQFVAVTVELIQ